MQSGRLIGMGHMTCGQRNRIIIPTAAFTAKFKATRNAMPPFSITIVNTSFLSDLGIGARRRMHRRLFIYPSINTPSMTPQIEGERRKGQRRKRKCVLVTEESGGMSWNGYQAGKDELGLERNLKFLAWRLEEGMKSESSFERSEWERKTSFFPFNSVESTVLRIAERIRMGEDPHGYLINLPPYSLSRKKVGVPKKSSTPRRYSTTSKTLRILSAWVLDFRTMWIPDRRW
jgi:hypothetical protein